MGRPKKDKFDAIESDYKDLINSSNGDEIRGKIAQVAIDLEDLLKAKSEDQALEEKVEQAKLAGEVYREGIKTLRQKIKYAREVLKTKGVTVVRAKPAPDSQAKTFTG